MEERAAQVAADEQLGTSAPVAPAPPSQIDQDLALLQQQFAAAPQSPAAPQFVSTTSTSSTTQRQSAELSPQEAAQTQAAGAQHTQAAQQVGAQREAAVLRMQGVLERQREQIDRDRARFGGQGEKLYARLEAANDELAQQTHRLAAESVDHNRFLDGMPTLKKGLWGIAVGLARFSTMGTEGMLGMLRGAIDTDIGQQRERIAQAANTARLTAQQRDRLWQHWQTIEDRKRALAEAAWKVELNAITLDNDRLDVRAKVADLTLRNAQLGIEASAKTRGKTTSSFSRSSTPHEISAKSLGQGAPEISKEELRKLRQDLTTMEPGARIMQRLRAKLEGLHRQGVNRPSLWKGIPDSDATMIQNELKQLALISRKALGDSGPVTDRDIPTYDLISNGRLGSISGMLRRLGEVESDYIARRKELVRGAYRTPAQLVGDALSQTGSRGAAPGAAAAVGAQVRR